jgi:hypothetical protein
MTTNDSPTRMDYELHGEPFPERTPYYTPNPTQFIPLRLIVGVFVTNAILFMLLGVALYLVFVGGG